jgi:hypothetical protein
MRKITMSTVPPPYQLIIKFTNHRNGKCTSYFKEVTKVRDIELAKTVTANTKKFFEVLYPNRIVKIWRKGCEVFIEKVDYGDVDNIVFGLILELLVQCSEISRTRKLMANLMRDLYPKSKIKELEKIEKKQMEQLKEKYKCQKQNLK